MSQPPSAPGDTANINVYLHPELQKWVYKDPKDNIEYEYDDEKRAWFPMVGAATVEHMDTRR
ncbi:hypothetical protein SYNPS1DRAFT_21402 [Syncephalis pseudoplumigaleata]|uniref:Uncharacterized protein n=1 Tax=Syncephalis pseudoplumigaleata TaxID=1712513 RepID=A0A4P9Z3F4_9FUNG|nr:hypothetical protein SYNPS1DRAFT_21402 [Syncephalis pseudoplumigaleata]|eukprot:RKP26945.1 hypothetical protein SYNPS1DRAFT_21402 [Syncephalis pseudoplumigaleata]